MLKRIVYDAPVLYICKFYFCVCVSFAILVLFPSFFLCDVWLGEVNESFGTQILGDGCEIRVLVRAMLVRSAILSYGTLLGSLGGSFGHDTSEQVRAILS